MRKQIHALWNSGFVRGVVLLSSGSAVSQIAIFLASPILSRLYGTEDFGVYALFSSAVNLITQVACLKYDLAIPLCKEDDKADSLFQLSLAVSVGLCALSLGILPFLRRGSVFLGGDWILLMPLTVLFSGICSSLTGRSLRRERYGRIAAAAVSRGVWMIFLQVGFGLAGISEMGLPLGQALSSLAGCLLLSKDFLCGAAGFTLGRIRLAAREFGGFPRFTTVGSIANALTYNLVSFLLALFYSQSQLGLYSMAVKLLSAPLTVFVNAVSQIYLRRSAQEQERSGSFRKTGLLLAGTGICVFGALFLCLPWAIRTVYGQEWAEAGHYARILLPLYLARFVVTPLSSSAIVMNKLSANMWWQAALLGISLLPALLRCFVPFPIETYLVWLSGGLSMGYLLFYAYCRACLKGQGWRHSSDWERNSTRERNT